MTKLHPITPSAQLIKEWIELSRTTPVHHPNPNVLATYAARWGANTELEACCEWLDTQIGAIDPKDLRTARRPKPPSLKNRALTLLQSVEASEDSAASWDFSVIRRALESLPD